MIGGIVRIYPEQQNILRTKCREFTEDFGELPQIAQIMIGIIQENKGMGLAANQIGVPLRIIALGTEQFSGVVVNPSFTPNESMGKAIEREGCMSLPGIDLPIERFKSGELRGFKWNGSEMVLNCDETLSRVVQHEVDHLDGILILDRVSYALRNVTLRKMAKIRKQWQAQMDQMSQLQERQANASALDKTADQFRDKAFNRKRMLP